MCPKRLTRVLLESCSRLQDFPELHLSLVDNTITFLRERMGAFLECIDMIIVFKHILFFI